MVALNAHTRAHIDHWVSRSFRPSASVRPLIQGLMAAQEQNAGWLTDELIAAVAKYLGPAGGLGLRGRELLLDVRDRTRSAATMSRCAPTSAAGSTAREDIVRHCEKKLGVQARAKHRRRPRLS